MIIENYYENPNVLHLGTCEPRAYFIPYLKEKNDSIICLSGNDWKFNWFQNHLEVNDDFAEGKLYDFDTISVPSCVNILGYDKHQYANARAPIPFDPPYVPSENPCGAYVKEFDLDEIKDEFYLDFEGVDSCFYLWINGEFVGYSQVSHSTSEFNITKFLKIGKNLMSVLVFKWCDGTYFEDQDKLRMTGIFRDVYILKRPKECISDFNTKTILGNSPALNINVKFANNPLKVTYTLISPKGYAVCELSTDETKLTLDVEKPLLWNAETPNLYTLHMKTEYETITQKIGFKHVEIIDSVFYLNGQNIKFKGVNRHDSDPYTGYTISPEQLKKDLQLMKNHNINAIRTSHYPNAPWAYEMFSEYGFYIIDEADIETHNTMAIYGGGRDDYDYKKQIITAPTFGLLCSDPVYEKTILDRIERCVSRDRNQACVVMWSLGNESGYGPNMEKAAKWIKDQDKDFLIHYESSIYQMRDHENDLSNIDVYSRMYMSVENCAYYCENLPKKPFVGCEFSHAMGNSCGDLFDYFEVMYKYKECAGSFVWEWCDHGIYAGKTVEGKDKFLYGGDFGEFPVEGNFCMDGLVYPDRTPHTSLLEHKNVARPVIASFKDNKIELFNTLDFVNTKDFFDIKIEYYLNNQLAEEKVISDFDLNPHEIKKLIFDVPTNFTKDDDAYLMINYILKGNVSFVEKGSSLGFDQIILNKKAYLPVISSCGKMNVIESGKKIEVSGDNFKYIFDKFLGVPVSIISNNTSYLTKPTEYNIWRAPLDNDRNIKKKWFEAGYDRMTTKVYDTKILKNEDNVEVIFDIGLGAVFLQCFINLTSKFIIHTDGTLTVEINGKKDIKFPFLPRFGLDFYLPKSYEYVNYVGYGPTESYIDKHHATFYGNFTSTVTNMHEDYIKPQANGDHFGTKFLSLKNDFSNLTVCGEEFSFNVSHYSTFDLENTSHNFELKESDFVKLSLDYKLSGVGSNSCGPELIEKYRLNDETFNMKFVLQFN